jgi:D-glycero-D-manno-heptose 1,7-bisphosphate phosphatase
MPRRHKRVIFLDRDGTIIVDQGYLCRPEDIVFEENALAGLKALAALSTTLIVVTNQSGVGRGYFDHLAVDGMHQHIDELLRAQGIVVSAWLYCPHSPTDNCNCRKPAPEMLRTAAAAQRADLNRSIMIGDKLTDLQAASACGAKAVLVLTGQGALWVKEAQAAGHDIATDLMDAARIIASCHD